MNDLAFRIKKRLQTTWHGFRLDCQFSGWYGLLRIMDELGGRAHLSALSDWACERKDQWILNYLEKKLTGVIDQYQSVSDAGSFVENAPIWVCWWTGEQDAPALVQQCIKSIRKNAGMHPVYMVDAKSYTKYLDIPDYIIDKVNDGRMCIANFSDYLRFSLLEKYGGLWLDATIYCSAKIPEQYFQLPVFTAKSQPRKSHYISKFRWTSFCMGGYKNHVFFRFFKSAMEQYWKTENQAIDYLLVDYMIETAYRHIAQVKTDLDSLPINNVHRDDLQAAMNAALPAEKFDDALVEDTVLYKLSWRETYSLKTIDGKESIYAGFLKSSDGNKK